MSGTQRPRLHQRRPVERDGSRVWDTDGQTGSVLPRVCPIQRVINGIGRCHGQQEAVPKAAAILIERRRRNRRIEISCLQLVQNDAGSLREVLIQEAVALGHPFDIPRIGEVGSPVVSPAGRLADDSPVNLVEQFLICGNSLFHRKGAAVEKVLVDVVGE